MGFANISPYASSKGAVEALAKCLSLEYEKEGITFHILHPPLTRTKSSAPFPFPAEYKADPRTVGYGLAENINGKGFVICHSFLQKVQMELCLSFLIEDGQVYEWKNGGAFREGRQYLKYILKNPAGLMAAGFFIYGVNKFTSKGRIRGRTLKMRISKIQEMEDNESCSLC